MPSGRRVGLVIFPVRIVGKGGGDHVPRKMAWNTRLWVVDWTDEKVEMEVMVWGAILGRDWEQREMERSRTVEEEA